jgi:hypothetical protein
MMGSNAPMGTSHRFEIVCGCGAVALLAAASSHAFAAPKKKPKGGAAPAASASAAPAASASAAPPAPAPAPSAAPAATTDEESAPAAAPSSEDKKIAVGADLLFVLPVGTLSNLTGPQIGPLLRGGYRLMPQLEATARIGYLFAFGRSQSTAGGTNSTSVTDIPIWLGARYFLGDAPAGPYAAAEIGLNFLSASQSGTLNGQNFSQSNGSTGFGFDLGVGYVISKDLPIDLRLQYSYLNLIGAGAGNYSLMGFGLSAGYSLFF